TLGDGTVEAVLGDGADDLTMGDGNALVLGDGGTLTHYLSGLLDTATANSGSGDDIIVIGDGNVLVMGGAGADDMTAGLGQHSVFGDNGELHNDSDGALLSATTIDTLGTGDTVLLGDGDNLVIGGAGADSITTGAGMDVVLGDNGEVLFTGPTGSLVRSSIASLDDASGDGDVIDLGDGTKLVIGGVGSDTIDALAGGHDVVGDNGAFTYTNGNLTEIDASNSTDGTGDTVTLGAGDHRLVLGIGGDTLVAGNGGTLLMADNGTALLQEDGTVISITAATTGNDGADDVTLGDGNVVAVLGDGGDRFGAGDGDVTLVADGGTLDYYLSGILYTVVANSGTGGDDVITLGDGNIVALLGEGVDSLDAGSGSLQALGDSGSLSYYTDGVLDTATADSTTGDDDSLTFLDGDVLVLGGIGSDTIDAGVGQHRVLGDNGEVVNDTDGALLSATTLDTLGAADSITLGNGGNVVIAGQGGDTVTTGTGNDLILGDNGEIVFTGTTGALVRDRIGSLDDASGGDDVIDLGDGSKLVIGGVGSDTIDALAGSHDVAGDTAAFTYSNGNLTEIDASNSTDGAGDTVTLGTGDHRLVLGIGGDTLVAGDGRTLLLGDNGTVTLQEDGTVVSLVAATTAGDGVDDLSLGNGDVDAVLGDGGDRFGMGDGNAVLVGDGGSINYYLSGILDSVTATAGTGGSDDVRIGDGTVVVLLGEGGDLLDMGNGTAVLLGDSGSVAFYSDGVLDSVTADSATGGDDTLGALLGMATTDTLGDSDTVTLGDGDNVVILGQGGDTVTTGTGNDLVIGDNGQVLFTGTTANLVRDEISSRDDAAGGDDVIDLGDGTKLVIGGVGSDTIDALAGSHDLIGDNGSFTYSNGNLTEIDSSNSIDGAGDSVTLGAGNHRLVLGIGGDTLVAGNGSTLLMADNGTALLQEALAAGAGNSNLIGDGGTLAYYLSGLLDTATADSGAGGDDSVTLGNGTGSNVVLGGVGSDTLVVADGDHVIGGDNAFVHLDTDGALLQSVSLDVLGNSDIITAGNGDNVILGGMGADAITTGSGTDIVIGDNGEVLFTGTTGNLVRELITTQDGGAGGDDTIIGGDGDKVVLGGTGADSVTAGDGDHDVFGDNGEIVYTGGIATSLATTDPVAADASSGAGDTISIGSGANRVLGGLGGDSIATGDGFDVILGDLGTITLDGAGALLLIESTLTQQPGDDIITSGDGRGWIIGGVGSDTVTSGDGADGVLGDNGAFVFDDGGLLQYARSSDTSGSTTGDDVIDTGAGNDVVIASGGSDRVLTGDGDDIVLADGGRVDYVGRDGKPATIDLVQSGDPLFGGDDHVEAGAGRDAVIGGAAADHLDGGAGDDYVIGDGGLILYRGGRLEQMQTIDPYTGGGADFIIGGAGEDILFGGEGDDTFVANFLEDAVIGDYARFTAASKTLIRFGNDLIGTSQLGVYASNDPFLKETSTIDDGDYRPQIVSEGTLARLVRENARDGGHRVSGITEEVELAGMRDAEVEASLLPDPVVELMSPAAGDALPALPGTRADLAVPAPEFPVDESGEVADAASAAALMFGWGMVRRGSKKPKPVLQSWDAFQDGRG
ncbi:MAG: hypothetical protein K0S46_2182, partial [Moraxellaceae bacterium]|nr:hypothetical protein [Moraxellaceae bacterium]